MKLKKFWMVMALALVLSLVFGAFSVSAADTELTAAGGTLASGDYFLAGDVDLAANITVANGSTVTIDLKGHVLKGTGSGRVVKQTPHTHSWTYSIKSGTTDTIVATCNGTCDYAGTDKEVTASFAAAKYDGQTHGTVLKGMDGNETTTVAGIAATAISVSYGGTGYGPSATAPTNAGSYKAVYTVSTPDGELLLHKSFNITPATLSVTGADISYQEQEDGTFKAIVNDLTLSGVAEKDKPYTAYTATAVMLDADGAETTDLSEAVSVMVNLTLDETAAVNKNYTVSAADTFTLDFSDKDNIGLTVNITPGDVTVKEGKTATFTARVSYDHSAKKMEGLSNDRLTLTYQWYVDRNDGSKAKAIKGATESSYTTSAVTLENDGYKYTCTVKDNYTRKETSAPATLHVEPGIPTTGDENAPLLFAGLLLLSGAALALLKKRV